MARWISVPDRFPDPGEADEDGLLALGGTLSPSSLLAAYQAGIFPWSSQPILSWWSPDPRAIFDLDRFRPHRSLRRSLHRSGFRFTVDRDFIGVMRACAAPRRGGQGTWITPDFIAAYSELHRRGYAHSVEVFQGDELVGGLYGVAIGGYFGGESMFHRRTDASKAALGGLVELLRVAGTPDRRLLDVQWLTPHLALLGAIELTRAEYRRRLAEALALPDPFLGTAARRSAG